MMQSLQRKNRCPGHFKWLNVYGTSCAWCCSRQKILFIKCLWIFSVNLFEKIYQLLLFFQSYCTRLTAVSIVTWSFVMWILQSSMNIPSKNLGMFTLWDWIPQKALSRLATRHQSSGLRFVCASSQATAFWFGTEWNEADSANGGSRWEGEKKMLLGEASSKNSPYLNLLHLCSRLVGRVQSTTQRKDLQCRTPR